MKAITLAALGAALAVCTSGTARAQAYTNYPYCAVYSLRTESCAFNTWQQCMAMVSGRGGSCEPNAFYQPRPVVRRKARRS